ncbi:hypothetical protein DIPPA_24575 [Diplonema papillatum]|nr:hypothetical protein DIPPA_24575 [Diplonema papillatum]
MRVLLAAAVAASLCGGSLAWVGETACPVSQNDTGKLCESSAANGTWNVYCGGECVDDSDDAVCCFDVNGTAKEAAGCCLDGDQCCVQAQGFGAYAWAGCCGANETCCGGGCAPEGSSCCGSESVCQSNQVCCGGDTCCPAGDMCTNGTCAVPPAASCIAFGVDLSPFGSEARGSDTTATITSYPTSAYIVFNPCGPLQFTPGSSACDENSLACYGIGPISQKGTSTVAHAPGTWYRDASENIALYSTAEQPSGIFHFNLTFVCDAATSLTAGLDGLQVNVTYMTSSPLICGPRPPNDGSKQGIAIGVSLAVVIIIFAAGVIMYRRRKIRPYAFRTRMGSSPEDDLMN